MALNRVDSLDAVRKSGEETAAFLGRFILSAFSRGSETRCKCNDNEIKFERKHEAFQFHTLSEMISVAPLVCI